MSEPIPTPRTDAVAMAWYGDEDAVQGDFARQIERELAEANRLRDYHRNIYHSDWIENEKALESAGIDFTVTEEGGKPIITAIEELIAERDKLRAENTVLTNFINREMKMTMDDPRIEALKKEMQHSPMMAGMESCDGSRIITQENP